MGCHDTVFFAFEIWQDIYLSKYEELLLHGSLGKCLPLDSETMSVALRSRSAVLLDPVEVENRRRMVRCLAALALVISLGTAGFLITEEHWSLWQSLFFTLITITTVGYSDEGVSVQGKQFAMVLLLVGIGTTTYCMSSLVQIIISRQLRWKRKMKNQIERLSDHVIVCGYGRVGRTVCRQLAQHGVPFVVIEQNEHHYREAVESGFLALHGSATDDQVLLAAGVKKARTVVCLVDSDAENVFIALSARDLNPKSFIICRAESESAIGKAHRAGARMVVSPYFAAGSDVAQAILRPNLAQLLEHHHSSQGFDLTELTVEPDSPLVGRTVAEVGRANDTVVFVALKSADGQTIVRPPGELRFQSGDVLFLAGTREDLAQFLEAHGSKVPVPSAC